MRQRFFHGGVRDLAQGDLLLPASVTGAISVGARFGAIGRADRVYASTNVDTPRVYAAIGERGGGDVDEVKLFGDLEHDFPSLVGASDEVPADCGLIVRVIERRVPIEV